MLLSLKIHLYLRNNPRFISLIIKKIRQLPEKAKYQLNMFMHFIISSKFLIVYQKHNYYVFEGNNNFGGFRLFCLFFMSLLIIICVITSATRATAKTIPNAGITNKSMNEAITKTNKTLKVNVNFDSGLISKSPLVSASASFNFSFGVSNSFLSVSVERLPTTGEWEDDDWLDSENILDITELPLLLVSIREDRRAGRSCTFIKYT